MIGKIVNSVAGIASIAKNLDTIMEVFEKTSKKVSEVCSERKQKNVSLKLVGTLEMVVMERYDLTGKVIFDEEGFAANQDPDTSYSCIRFRIRNTGEQKITWLELNQAVIVQGDDLFHGETRDIIFGTEKKGMQQELTLMPDEEEDIYFIVCEKMLSLNEDEDEDEENLLNDEELYFVICLEVMAEGAKDMKEISMEAVYRNGNLVKCGNVQFDE